MKIPYYPGCTLNTVAKVFDASARKSAISLGFELEELGQWNCCGAAFPLTPDNLMALSAPAKVLSTARKTGDAITTLCSVCYNVLKRTNKVLKEDREKRNIVAGFIEEDYDASINVIHFLEVLRDTIGFEKVKKSVKRPLKGIRAGAYYGCMLLRPSDIAIDRCEGPAIMEDLLGALGCKPVDFPNKIECCGAHLSMTRRDIVERLSANVMTSAVSCGAELIVTSCPLCQYNLEKSQTRAGETASGYKEVPIVYFTQVLGIALGQTDIEAGLDGNQWDIRPLLKERGV